MKTNRRHFLKGTLAVGITAIGTSWIRAQKPLSYVFTTNTDPQNHNDPNLHLFLDDEDVASIKHLERVINKPRKRPEPVVQADRPWEGERAQAWGSVIQEPDGLFRMWYFAFNTERRWDSLDVGGYCYAESRDGIHWEKPNLNLFEFRGSKRNNLFYSCAPDGKNLVEEELARRGLGLTARDARGKPVGVLNNLDGLTVVRDDDDPDPQRRYKLIANMQDHRMWAPAYPERYPGVTEAQIKQARRVFGQYLDTSPDGIHWTRKPQRLIAARGGDYMMATRDHRNRRWWLNERAHDQGGRNASLRTSSDWKKWSELTVAFGKSSDPDFNKTFQWHGGITPFNYGNMNVGMLEKWPLAGHGANCELACQREGGKWTRVAPKEIFLDTGPEGSFDRMLAYPSHNPPGRVGDDLYIFYTGAGARNHPRRGMPMAMGLATLKLDRFAGLAQWRYKGAGSVVTKPLQIPHPHLAVNVDCYEYEPIRVAVTRPDGTPIPGYSANESAIPVDREHVYSFACWNNKKDLSELVGQTVALQFFVSGAALYSYRFYPRRT